MSLGVVLGYFQPFHIHIESLEGSGAATNIHKVVKTVCLKLKILITTEPIEFFILWQFHTGPGIV